MRMSEGRMAKIALDDGQICQIVERSQTVSRLVAILKSFVSSFVPFKSQANQLKIIEVEVCVVPSACANKKK